MAGAGKSSQMVTFIKAITNMGTHMEKGFTNGDMRLFTKASSLKDLGREEAAWKPRMDSLI